MKTLMALLLVSVQVLAEPWEKSYIPPDLRKEFNVLPDSATFSVQESLAGWFMFSEEVGRQDFVCSRTILGPVIEQRAQEFERRGQYILRHLSDSQPAYSRAYYTWREEQEYLQEIEDLVSQGRIREVEMKMEYFRFIKHLIPILSIDAPVLENFDEVYEEVARPLGH